MTVRLRSAVSWGLGLLPRGAILLSALTFTAYAMGLVRDRVFARTFGASLELDAYNAALIVPELVLDVLVIAGLSAAFVPVWSRTRTESPDTEQAFSRTVLTMAIVLMGVADVVLFVLAPATADLVVPGFGPAERQLYVELFRIMLVTALIFAASFALGEMLVGRQRFLAYGAAPILYNAGIVFGAVVLSPTMGIYGVAVGTVIGALLHLGVRSLDIRRTDFRFRPRLDIRAPAFVEYVRLSIPKAVAQPIEPLIFLYFTSVASTFVAGSVSSVSFARNFQSVPVSLIGVAFAVTAFPVLSAAWAGGDRAGFTKLVRTNLLTISALTVGAAIALAVVAQPAIDILLGGEAFDEEDVQRTSALLMAFAISVPLEAGTHLMARAVYATHNTILPVLASIGGLLATIAAAAVLADGLGLMALPVGFAVGQGIKLLALGLALAARLRAAPS
ncbi:MAG TPA: lipid II flippase MurJ [Candidatus Limnocylindrales bacterium]